MKISKKEILSFLLLILIIGLPKLVMAGFGFSTDLDELEESGLSKKSISEIILNLMNWLLIIITVFAIIGFIVSGIYYITAQASGKLEEAKNWLIYSIIGVAVGIMGYVIVRLVDNLIYGRE